MLIREGITSFGWRAALPEFPFVDFQRIVFSCAPRCGFSVVEIVERGITPNFHTAILEHGNERLHMLCHSTHPIVAFAEPRKLYSCALVFRDAKVIAASIVEMFPDIYIATATELAKSIAKSDLDLLNPAEIEQIKYWQPATIGELAFNWWD